MTDTPTYTGTVYVHTLVCIYGTSHSKLHDVRRSDRQSISGQSTVDQRSVNCHEAVKVRTNKMADLIDFRFSKLRADFSRQDLRIV